MTKRATFTQAELERADRAAQKLGKLAAVIGGAIVLVPADFLPRLDTPAESAKGAQPKAWPAR